MGRAIRRRLERLGDDLCDLIVVNCGAVRTAGNREPLPPLSQKFRRHNPTVGNDTPTSRAICVLLAPSAARSTILARNACC